MFKNFKNKKLSTYLFVGASLASFFVFLFFIFLFSYSSSGVNSSTIQEIERSNMSAYETVDPFITKRKSLRDLLNGPIISNDDPSLGNIDSKVNIVYFSDFKCDYCKKQEEIIQKLFKKYDGSLRLTWKDYPELNADSESYQASIAGRCAMEQGAFWDYHDLLFSNNSILNEKVFYDIADNIGLDLDEFKSCLNTKKPNQKIINNIEEANALEINGVPFIYVNKQDVMGEISFEELERLVLIEQNREE